MIVVSQLSICSCYVTLVVGRARVLPVPRRSEMFSSRNPKVFCTCFGCKRQSSATSSSKKRTGFRSLNVFISTSILGLSNLNRVYWGETSHLPLLKRPLLKRQPELSSNSFPEADQGNHKPTVWCRERWENAIWNYHVPTKWKTLGLDGFSTWPGKQNKQLSTYSFCTRERQAKIT